MDTICLASLAWIQHRDNSESLIARLATAVTNASTTLHLDLAAVLREEGRQDGDASPPCDLFVIAMSSWLKDGVTEDGVLDVERIRKAPYGFPAGGIVVLDATGHKSGIVVAALHQARHALYPIQQWPALFVLIIDDAQMFQVSPILASTFQLLPNVLPPTAIKREARQFMQYVRLLRVFGRNMGLVAKALRWRTNRINRLREHRINRGLGWTWEE